jgi:predicted HTH domain antitoxin
MTITVDLPCDFLDQPEPHRLVIEAIAIAGYKSEAMTLYQTGRLLGLSRFELDGFLKDHNVMEHAYSEKMLEQDLVALERLPLPAQRS